MNADKISALRAVPFSEPELTPAASEKLDQNIEYLRLQILREISREYGSGHRARASDVDSAVSRIGVFDSTFPLVSRTAILAITLSSISLLVQVFNQVTKPNEVWLGTGVALLVGITSGTTLVVVIQEARRRKRQRSVSLQELLHAFNKLEDSMRIRARELIGPSADGTSLGRIISAVELLQLWTPDDSLVFRRLLSIRNSIVHEDGLISATAIASAFSKIARLSALLDSSGSSKPRMREFATTRAALSFEERVTNTLRRAGIDVSSTQGDLGYDLLAGKSDLFKRIIIKYRQSGLLKVDDVSSVVNRPQSNIPTVIVTNAAISPYVFDYLELVGNDCQNKRQIIAVRWRGSDDTDALVNKIIAKNAES